MRPAVIASLAASGVLGAAALFVARVWLPSLQAEDAAARERPAVSALIPVVVAKAAIPAGTKLEAGKLTLARLPADAAPEGAYASIEALMAQGGGAPVVLSPLAPREPVLAGRLSDGGAKPSVAAVIEPGKRAYTIGVTTPAGGGGHILPGDRVDVLLARTEPGRSAPEGAPERPVRADLVLQNVRVLAINFNADLASTERAAPSTATLEVSLNDAGRLAIAAEAGDLSLALRRIGASETAPARPVVAADLTGRYAAKAAPVRRAAPAPRASPRAAAPRLVIINGDTPAKS